jgi:hypothetical protein
MDGEGFNEVGVLETRQCARQFNVRRHLEVIIARGNNAIDLSSVGTSPSRLPSLADIRHHRRVRH